MRVWSIWGEGVGIRVWVSGCGYEGVGVRVWVCEGKWCEGMEYMG